MFRNFISRIHLTRTTVSTLSSHLWRNFPDDSDTRSRGFASFCIPAFSLDVLATVTVYKHRAIGLCTNSFTQYNCKHLNEYL